MPPLVSDQGHLKSVNDLETLGCYFDSAFQERRQTLKKPSSAKRPVRGPALVRLRKKEKESDPLEQMVSFFFKS